MNKTQKLQIYHSEKSFFFFKMKEWIRFLLIVTGWYWLLSKHRYSIFSFWMEQTINSKQMYWYHTFSWKYSPYKLCLKCRVNENDFHLEESSLEHQRWQWTVLDNIISIHQFCSFLTNFSWTNKRVNEQMPLLKNVLS